MACSLSSKSTPTIDISVPDADIGVVDLHRKHKSTRRILALTRAHLKLHHARRSQILRERQQENAAGNTAGSSSTSTRPRRKLESTTTECASTSCGKEDTVWKYAPADAHTSLSLSEITSGEQDNLRMASSIPTKLLRISSTLLQQHDDIVAAFIISIKGFSSLIINHVISFITGAKGCSKDWLEQMDVVELVDVAILAHHLGVHALQFIAISSLRQLLLDNGSYPNRAMAIHVWAVTKPDDPIRQLILSSVYAAWTTNRVTINNFREGDKIDEIEAQDNMWLASFRKAIISLVDWSPLALFSAYDSMVNSYLRVWKEEVTRGKPGLYRMIDSINDARSKGCLEDSSFYSYFDFNRNTSDAHLYQHLSRRGYLPSSGKLPLIRPRCAEIRSADGPEENSSKSSIDIETSDNDTRQSKKPKLSLRVSPVPPPAQPSHKQHNPLTEATPMSSTSIKETRPAKRKHRPSAGTVYVISKTHGTELIARSWA